MALTHGHDAPAAAPDGPAPVAPAMTVPPEPATAGDPAPLIDPAPLVDRTRTLTNWAGPAFSLAFLVAVAWQLRSVDWADLFRLTPVSAVFWGAFVLYYLAGPVSEQIIYKRLWNLPGRAFVQLLGKQVSNELLLGYLGEVYFYAWAKRNAQITTAPFGAIKDVAILSAMIGNVFTLALVLLSAPLFSTLSLEISSTKFGASVAFIMVTSMAVTFWRKRLFSLPRAELRFVSKLHAVRIVVLLVLGAVMWHQIMPQVELVYWLLLGTLRQLVSRLPFVPNKDVVFAGLAAFLVGPDSEIVAAVTLHATLVLGAHLLVGAVLGIAGLISQRSLVSRKGESR